MLVKRQWHIPERSWSGPSSVSVLHEKEAAIPSGEIIPQFAV